MAGLTALALITAPSGARLPYRIAIPPSGASGRSSGRRVSASSQAADAATSASDTPQAVGRERSSSADRICSTAGTPPAAPRSEMVREEAGLNRPMRGVERPRRSQSARFSGRSSSWARAATCSTRFVEQPRACATVMMFCSVPEETTARKVRPAAWASTAAAPARRARASSAGFTAPPAADVASSVALPGSDRPAASLAMAILFAVPIMLQVPGPGQAARSISARSWRVMAPRVARPMASFTSLATRVSPCHDPGAISPPVTNTVGRSSRAAAMSMPGRILSQEATQTRASSP